LGEAFTTTSEAAEVRHDRLSVRRSLTLPRKRIHGGSELSSQRVAATAARPQPAPDPVPPETEKPARSKFPNRFTGQRLTPEAAARQGRVTQLAWRLLGGREAAIAYLNAHDERLGGRPLDLAVASEEACLAVERSIAQHAGTQQ